MYKVIYEAIPFMPVTNHFDTESEMHTFVIKCKLKGVHGTVINPDGTERKF